MSVRATQNPVRSDSRTAAREPQHDHSACHAGFGLLAALARHARERGADEAVTECDARGRRGVNWAELYAMVRARASVLARAGARARGGGRGVCVDVAGELGPVVVPLEPGAEMAAWTLAGLQAGRCVLPLHPTAVASEGPGVARRAGAFAVVLPMPGFPGREAALALASALNMSVPDGPWNASSRAGVATSAQLAVCVASRSDLPPEHARAGVTVRPALGPSLVLASSGTTGLPRLAVRSLAALDADARQVVAGLGLTAQSVLMAVIPLSHSYGVDVLVGSVLSGAALRVVHPMDACVVARELCAGVTVLPGVPFVFEALARCTPGAHVTLRTAVSAGSPLPARAATAFTKSWGVPVGQLFGSTELGTVLVRRADDQDQAQNADRAHEADLHACVGPPLPGVRVRVLDLRDPARDAPAGETGELCVAASSMLSAYLDEPGGLEASLTPDGLLRTGDLASLDARGRVHIRGRTRLLIDIGGFKVNPLEVEHALLTHPGVAEAAVLGVAQSETLQRLRAIVVPASGTSLTSTSLRAHLRRLLSPAKLPRRFDLADSLPKTATGKLRRELLASWPVRPLGPAARGGGDGAQRREPA